MNGEVEQYNLNSITKKYPSPVVLLREDGEEPPHYRSGGEEEKTIENEEEATQGVPQ